MSVRFLTYPGMTFNTTHLESIKRLALEAAKSANLSPAEILLRSHLHNTTSWKPDPLGWHITASLKEREQLEKKEHTTFHAYTPGKHNYDLKSVEIDASKSDSTARTGNALVWGDDVVEV